MVNDSYIQKLPDDPIEAALTICETFKKNWESSDNASRQALYKNFFELYIIFTSLLDAIGVRYIKISKKRDVADSLGDMYDFFFRTEKFLLEEGIIRSTSDVRNALFIKYGISGQYELTNGDLNRVQELVNEIRELLSASDVIEDDYKHRLLQKLEKFQSELHKKISDLDRFYSFIGDASVLLKKVGENAKPIVDRMKEIVEIGWRTQARKEELPSNSKPALISSNDASDD